VIVGAVSAQWLAGEALGAREWLGGALILFAAWLASRQQMQD
jgi:drug/metabolite transporter (DMT)-like permease